jgi:hypothetical protein
MIRNCGSHSGKAAFPVAIGMKTSLSKRPFTMSAIAAFPFAWKGLAIQAEQSLAPFVDDTYRTGSTFVQIGNSSVYIPERLHFLGLNSKSTLTDLPLGSKALLTRSTDGFLREIVLKEIIGVQQVWVPPFVVLLMGEYVIEIVERIADSMESLDQTLYSNFVRENRNLIQILRQRAASYWDCYYRHSYPSLNSYPGTVLLRELERWAS